jgi:hypothetical protein
MYRLIHPGDRQELPLRMLFDPVEEGVFLKACEADSYRGLVGALLDDPAYEVAEPQARLVERLRIANDVALLAAIEGRRLQVSDREGPDTIVVASDEPLLHSLDQFGFVSLAAASSSTRHIKF